jgi:hypothetical protein
MPKATSNFRRLATSRRPAEAPQTLSDLKSQKINIIEKQTYFNII